jgi:hypothetical protein
VQQDPEFPRKPDPTKRPSRRAYFLVCAFAVLLVIFPFLFWHGTWFGRPLSDSDIESNLNNMAAKPREAQHALVQIGERIGRGEMDARRWYPKVIEAAASPSVELRQTAAWIMGQDHTYEPFHPALVKLLGDPSAMVRRNAALSLSNFGDPAALPELRGMLRSSEIPSPAAGTIKFRLKAGEYVNPGTLVARVGDIEARAPLPGEVIALRVSDGAQVNAGDPIADVSVDKEHVWEALRALVRLGGAEDIEVVQRYLRGAPGMPGKIQQQASLTLQAIQNRAR